MTLGHIFECDFRGNGWCECGVNDLFKSGRCLRVVVLFEKTLWKSHCCLFHVQAACSFHNFVFWWGARIIERSLVSLVTWLENDQIIYRSGCWECLIPIDIEFHLYNFTLYDFVLTLNIDVSWCMICLRYCHWYDELLLRLT